jgi:HlyD family secretion protein
MSVGSSLNLLQDVHTLFDSGTATGLSDRQLLERFAAHRDAAAEAAFEVLVLRHGPMVLRVCRNSLADPHDAQDAFQATFLILVKQRGSIRRLESVGSWLFGVATRVAAKARVAAARRRAAERRGALRVVEAVDSSNCAETDEPEFGPVLQTEVCRLPAKYRSAILLCYWQGLTQDQAAAQLGCPLGTVRSRLARARKLLHRRLIRAGLAPLASTVAAVIDRSSVSAASISPQLPPLTPALVRSTIQAASHFAAGRVISQVATGFTASLVQRFLWSITMLKIGTTLAAVAIVGIVGFGMTAGAQRVGRAPADGTSTRIEENGANRGGPLDQPPAEINQAAGAATQGLNPGHGEKVYSKLITTIKSIVPDGSQVKKGQVVCELDSAALQDQLINGMITAKTAAASYEQAKLTREVSELAVVEYVEGLYKNELTEIELQIKTAEAELAIAEDDLEAARDAFNKTEKPGRKRFIAELQLKKARFALELAQSRKRVLVDYTSPKRIKELKSAVEKERADELAKKVVWELEESRARRLQQQLAVYTIKAPISGTLVYAKSDLPPGGQAGMMMAMMGRASPQPIRQGVTVQDGQFLFEIIPAPEERK